MVRTQVYLTKKQHDELAKLAEATGKKQGELIREAVLSLIEESARQRRQEAIQALAELSKDRDDLPDSAAMRAESDRRLG